jgi:HK97 family phage prohead protease
MKKQYTNAYVKEVKEDGVIVGAVATTDSPDRDGEILSIDGWELDNFIKNPVLLWGHDSRALPIGKVTNIKRAENSLLFDAKFAIEENDFAAKVAKLVKGGYLNTFSVGFLPKQREGDKFTKQELLEISVVNVPANPEAEVSREFKDFQKAVKSIEKRETKESKKEVKEKVKEEIKKEVSKIEKTSEKKKEVKKEVKEIKEEKKIEEKPKKELKKKVKKEVSKESEKVETEQKSPTCRKKGETEAECRARKIPEIMDEGYKRDQAVAMAYSMCKKPCKAKDSDNAKESEKELPKIDIKTEKEGRIVSEKNRILIRNTVSTLKEASDALEGLLKVTESPKGEREVGKPSIAKKDNKVLKALKRLDREIEHLILTEKGK